MTPKEIHEVLCKADDADKMKFAISCQLNGTTPQNVERVLADVLTSVQKSLKPALEFYKYLEGGN